MNFELGTSLVIFLVGLALGSFANVVIHRMDNLRTILSVPSHCPHCRRRLAWFDLIPLLSYLQLQGRCRYCGKPISLQYPLVELALGLMAVFLYLQFGLTAGFFVNLLLVTSLVVLFVHDLLHMLLPDVVVYPGIVLAAASFFLRRGKIEELLIGVLIGAGFLGLLYILGKGNWIGFGDVKLGVLVGALLGWPLVVAALLVAFMTGAAVASLLLLRRRVTMKSPIPFGPFLVFGTLVALFFGKELLVWYHRAFV